MSTVIHLIIKEFTLELRRKAVVAGIGLYLFSLIFICYITFSLRQSSINQVTWSALFWLTILFSAVNSIAKSFIGERRGMFIYMYMIASPQAIILAKIIYNAFLCTLLAVTGYFLFAVFISDPVQDHLIFMAGLILTCFGFASSLSIISGIAAKANNSNVLMAVLSFPIVIAILLMAMKITLNSLDGLDPSASTGEILNLLAINSIATALAYLLFPYIWRS